MLCALVRQFGGDVGESGIVKDSFDGLQEALKAASEQNDLIVTAGGASVGDRDYLPSVVKKLGAVHFHKVSLKPGKPVLFGTIGNASIVCLPGNPASAFVCAHLFVRAALEAMLGQNRPYPRCTIALKGDVTTGSRDEFFRCVLENGEAVIHGEQSSFGVQSLMQADCLVHVPANTHHKSGELRPAIILK
jgi:molybdopterin molybdotransferase